MAWINGEEVADHELPRSWAAAFSYDGLREAMKPGLRAQWDEVGERFHHQDYRLPQVETDEWGVIWVKGELCPHSVQQYSTLPPVVCQHPAGAGTDHEGVGLCATHKGNQKKKAREGAIIMAYLFGEEMQVTPWEALLSQVRILANQVRYCQNKIQNLEMEFGVDAIAGEAGQYWIVLMEARGERLAKVAKMAIDAGVAERLVRQVELEVDNMVIAAMEMMDSLGIHGQQRDEALEQMGRRLLELEAGSAT